MDNSSDDSWLSGKRVAVIGRLAGMTKRELVVALRGQNAELVNEQSAADMVVVADDSLLDDQIEESLSKETAEDGRPVEVVRESRLWEHLGLVDSRLYTPAMLAELLRLPLATIRRWQRRGLITPVREIRRLPYYDFQQVSWARRLVELIASGMSPAAIEKKLSGLAQFVPDVDRHVTQLNVIVEGREILMRQGEGLIDAGGQMRIDFDAFDEAKTISMPSSPAHGGPAESDITGTPRTWDEAVDDPDSLLDRAAELEDAGELELAVDIYHTVLAIRGPTAEICFQLAETLYRQGRADAAAERYFVAIELDEDFVEARANLGCVLMETGRSDLAIASFRGALQLHPDYPDVHYHLAQALDDLGERSEAEEHWRTFLALAPDSPWADEAAERLTP
jgi:tetratricopeptide (TPR) repeat protein